MKLDLPDSFLQKIEMTFGLKGQAWLRELPSQVQHYLSLWNLKADGHFNQKLSFNFVLPVTDIQGEKAVLKMGPHLKGRAKESFALDVYQGAGAVRLLNFDGANGVSLLERAVPGTELKLASLNNGEATKIAAGVIEKLQRKSPDEKPPELTHISVWGLGFEKFLRESRRGTDFRISTIEKADRLFKELVSSSHREVLLHGDLHHSNLLQATREPWLAIDPKGVWGDPIYEVGAFIRNPMPELLTFENLEHILEERIKIFSEALNLEATRVWGWSYSQCVLAAIWAVEEGPNEWQKWLQVADVIETLKPL